MFADSCDTLREYSVAGCDLKSLQQFTKQKQPGHWRSKSGGTATAALADSFQKTVVMHERTIATHLTYLVPWKFLEFRNTELTKSVQASRDRYSAWTSNAKGSSQQADVDGDYRGGVSPSLSPSSNAAGSSGRPLSVSASGPDAESGGTQNWIQWMVGQLTQLAQLLQDYQDHAARYRHMCVVCLPPWVWCRVFFFCRIGLVLNDTHPHSFFCARACVCHFTHADINRPSADKVLSICVDEPQ